MTIHDPKEIPIPEENGFNVALDSASEIRVSPAVHQRFEYSYDPCAGDSWKYNKKYTKIACKTMCRDKDIRQNYNCYIKVIWKI